MTSTKQERETVIECINENKSLSECEKELRIRKTIIDTILK
jgi:hypothetical protein